MIDIGSNLVAIEKLMELMEKHHIDEISCDYINMKKSKFKGEKAVLTPQELLAKHLEPGPSEPWMNIPEGVVDAWTKGVK